VKIEIANLQPRNIFPERLIRYVVNQVLSAERVRRAHVSLAFVCDRRMQSLNKKFLNHDYPTDVLAFNMGNREGRKLDAEIIISTATAWRQAREFGSTFERELTLYIIHGLLHVLGYDDHSTRDTRKMRQREELLMKKIFSDKLFL